MRTEPALPAEKAIEAAFGYAGGRAPGDVLLQKPRLEIVTASPAGTRAAEAYRGRAGQGYSHRLVWSVVFQRPPEQSRWEALLDAASGEVLAFQDRNHYVNRQVTGGVYPLTNTDQCPSVQSCGEMMSGWPMPFADTGLPPPNRLTNSAGIFDFTGQAPLTTMAFEELGTALNDAATFATRTVDLSAYAGQTIRILFTAGDNATDQLLEAAVDDVRIVVQ